MLLRLVTVTDNVTGSTEEQIEEFDDIEIKLIEEGDVKFIEFGGEDKLKELRCIVDLSDEETIKLIKTLEKNIK